MTAAPRYIDDRFRIHLQAVCSDRSLHNSRALQSTFPGATPPSGWSLFRSMAVRHGVSHPQRREMAWRILKHGGLIAYNPDMQAIIDTILRVQGPSQMPPHGAISKALFYSTPELLGERRMDGTITADLTRRERLYVFLCRALQRIGSSLQQMAQQPLASKNT